jgi:hypothetical protein
MIFSFRDGIPHDLNHFLTNDDIFCFFSVANAVQIHEKYLSVAILATLKRKRGIYLLEHPTESLPTISNSQRWHIFETGLWLAPRAASTISQALFLKSDSYEYIKNWLINHK